MEERDLWPSAELLPKPDPVLLADELILLAGPQVVHEVHLVPTVEQIAPSRRIRATQRLPEFRLVLSPQKSITKNKIIILPHYWVILGWSVAAHLQQVEVHDGGWARQSLLN